MNRPPELASSSPSMSNQPHPAVQALEKFAASTPLVTRFLVYLQWTTYVLSWIVPDPALALALSNYPEFSVKHWEIYRLITSVLVNTRLADLIFVYWLVVPASTVLERCFGSAKMAVLVGSLTVWTNLLFVLLWLLGSAFATGTYWTTQSTSSVWIIGFGLMSLEAMMSLAGGDHDDGSHNTYRKICFLTVRAQYAPALLYVLTGILSLRYDLGCLVSLLLGYALGAHHHQCRSTEGLHGGVRSIGAFWDRIMLNALPISQLQRCEETGLLAPLVEFSRSSSRSSGGWVASHSASGIHAWNNASRAGPTLGHGGPANNNESVRRIHAKRSITARNWLDRFLNPPWFVCIVVPCLDRHTDASIVPNAGPEGCELGGGFSIRRWRGRRRPGAGRWRRRWRWRWRFLAVGGFSTQGSGGVRSRGTIARSRPRGSAPGVGSDERHEQEGQRQCSRLFFRRCVKQEGMSFVRRPGRAATGLLKQCLQRRHVGSGATRRIVAHCCQNMPRATPDRKRKKTRRHEAAEESIGESTAT
jgi:hypothetical protein